MCGMIRKQPHYFSIV